MNDGKPFFEVVVDHARFLLDEPCRERMRREVAAGDHSALAMVDVEHELDFYCCALEPWSVTLLRLLHARWPRL